MADSSSLILKALTRAAAQPSGVPLYTSKADDGLFPATTVGKAAARKALDDGLISVVRHETVGKAQREIAAIAPPGLARLQAESDPKQVLEDFVRILEIRERQVAELLQTSRDLAETMTAMKTALGAILPQTLAARIPASACLVRTSASMPILVNNAGTLTEPDVEELDEALLTHLSDWAGNATAGQDCPLPELFRALGLREHPPTIGTFHDVLRRLHADCRLYLHPWTGPLYALPEPSYALLVGHNIAYYASPRR